MSRLSEPQREMHDQRHRQLQRVERRRLWLSVLLPFSFVLAIVVVFTGISLSLRSPVQVAILSDSLLTILVLCPLVVIAFPVMILSFSLVALASRWHAKSRSPLRRLEAWTAVLEANIEIWLGQVDERVLNWAVRLAPVRQVLKAFDPPADVSLEERDE